MPRQTDVTETQAWVKLLPVFCISIKSFGNIQHVQFTDQLHGSIVAMPFFPHIQFPWQCGIIAHISGALLFALISE